MLKIIASIRKIHLLIIKSLDYSIEKYPMDYKLYKFITTYVPSFENVELSTFKLICRVSVLLILYNTLWSLISLSLCTIS